jgi:3-methylcrotonyl-CoA carboxylase alpha subunit
MIRSLLIANRGEIACRVIRTARRMAIRTIAVYSDADANALHVRSADSSVHIGPSSVRESYLDGERIIAAAKISGADAIHPGYGFLSENAEFAQNVQEAGLIWVGPNPASIAAMGLKDGAKRLMRDAGVPITPGYLGGDQSPDRLRAEAEAIGYPVLIKAVAGGGGKGMRKVDSAGEFDHALESCRREATSSFGNGSVLLEKWIADPRHIEVQVFGDSHGNIVHLFERDCSLQRRHQKVIEEAPAPGMDEETRTFVCHAAIDAAKAVDYIGAGTIEFIADASEGLRADRIWFMEMNTRLQVEHPVTEEITGEDLVEWQLRVAFGEPLPKQQDELSINGCAMEARLYAEDPARGFLPSVGVLSLFRLGGESTVRVETGVTQGGEVSSFYDPLIAKIISHGATRDIARSKLAEALRDSAVWPIKTNAGFLVKALEHPEFVARRLDTGLIEREIKVLMPSDRPDEKALAEAAASLSSGGPLAGFRLNALACGEAKFLLDGEAIAIQFDPREGSNDEALDDVLVMHSGQVWQLSHWRADGARGVDVSDGMIRSPMPGRIVVVGVSAGEAVAKGQKLLTLEAMKIEHGLIAPFDGIVAELNASVGGQVSEGALLVKIVQAADQANP